MDQHAGPDHRFGFHLVFDLVSVGSKSPTNVGS